MEVKMDEIGEERKNEMSTPQEGDGKSSKRRMKTAYQLELLEKTYAVDAYPNEAVRADMSVKLGLTDRQLQMWFCHRRLKDRKTPPASAAATTTTSAPTKRQKKESPVEVSVGTSLSGIRDDLVASSDVGRELFPAMGLGLGTAPSLFGQGRVVARPCGVALARFAADLPPVKRYFETPETIMEMRAIAFVEAQLGEPLREDGPILGLEFDPLPPDAFGAPLGTAGQQKQIGKSYEMKIFDRTDFRLPKGANRALHEYQFLPEQPSVRNDPYHRGNPSHFYGSLPDAPSLKTSPLSAGRPFMHNELPIGFGFQSQIPSANFLPQSSRQGHLASSGSGEYETVSRNNSFPNLVDPQYASAPINMLETPLLSSDHGLALEEDASRLERKRKGDEARIAKELEANEKRIRKELEKQDLLRRKKEEQMRKDMERQDRERRKEEERMMREKLKEEERFQKEQKRELERREKFLQRESIRAEKQRQKDELRREKEAARLKAANDRAIARRIAKESMELIEDERLELMELATSEKGFPSLLSLDFETLQNLETYRDMLSVFPPKTVNLKKPFAIPPWLDSEENVGNLLLVWKFLHTFADVLGIWPFTLDEFLQAFHDYDPRLLSEVHIAILRCIIKDIEDVARIPSTGLGSNQYSIANPGGGHPQIVEGAYAWGFDIRSWQRHLNPLTWPEILRQLAISAGFGPKLKKKNIELSSHPDDLEGNNCQSIISKLRNGTAAENAVAIMTERGYSNPGKSRHRLTPGTVKYAAFHILSMEGSKGITILEVADKIQKSGLRDLTTSRTPEASIAAALSRDTTLFERTAPSTYCVRPAYRKESADAEAVISAAREKIRLFKNGFPDTEEVDDAEREEESDSDAAEDPDVEDLCNVPPSNTGAQNASDVIGLTLTSTSENGKETPIESGDTPDVKVSESLEAGNERSSVQAAVLYENKYAFKLTDQIVNGLEISEEISTPEQEDKDIDESYSGEPWVHGLVEGEYASLSVEERLNALVALVGLAIEGNSVRLVLEERLEAASTLKKQIWAEVQVDKRRVREDFVLKAHCPSLITSRSEFSALHTVPEEKQSPLLANNEDSNDRPFNPASQPDKFNDTQFTNNLYNNLSSTPIQDFGFGLDNIQVQLSGQALERSRSQLRSYINQKAEDTYVYRSLPLGQDRRRNRYWQFVTSASANEPGCSRIFVELPDGRWRLIDDEQDFDALIASLDVRGTRESHLWSMLHKVEKSFKATSKKKLLQSVVDKQPRDQLKLESCKLNSHPDCVGLDSADSGVYLANSEPEPSSSFTIELGKNEAERINALTRYQEFQRWVWSECCNSTNLCALKYGEKRATQLLGVCDKCHASYFFQDDHCPCCHGTFCNSDGSLRFPEHMAHCESKLLMDPCEIVYPSDSLPSRVRLLKVMLALTEVSIPPEALQPVWTETQRLDWGAKLNSLLTSEDLLQALTMLECAIKGDYLSPSFETTNELLHACKSADLVNSHHVTPVLPWIPKTTAAVALRLMEVDGAIFYNVQQKIESEKEEEVGKYSHPSNYDSMRNLQEDFTLIPHENQNLQENWVDPGISHGSNSSKRKRGNGSSGRVRGSSRTDKSRRKATGSKPEIGRKPVAPTNNGPLGQIPGWKVANSGQGARSQGRRTARSRQRPGKGVMGMAPPPFIPAKPFCSSRGNLSSNDWNQQTPDNDVENASRSSSSEYDEDNGQPMMNQEYHRRTPVNNYSRIYNNQSQEFNQVSYDDEDEYEDQGLNQQNEEDEEQADMDVVGRYITGYSDDEGVGNADPNVMLDDPAATESSSSDYSD